MATAPTWYPVMIVVVARPLRPARVNSLTIAIAVGRQPPRPTPARKRSSAKTVAFGANAHSRVNSENDTTAPMSALRRPTRSVSVPMVSAPTIMPTSPMVTTAVAPVPDSARSSGVRSVGMTVPTTTRSKPSSRTAIQHSGATQPAARPAVPAARPVRVDVVSMSPPGATLQSRGGRVEDGR